MDYRIWLGVLLIATLIAACTPPRVPVVPAPAGQPAVPTPGAAANLTQLIVIPDPDGAQVTVDGILAGRSPITLTLPAGAHLIALSAAGYAPYSETITLEAGREATYAAELEDIEAPAVTLRGDLLEIPWQGRAQLRAVARDNAGVADLALALGEQTLAASEGEELVFDFVPGDLAGPDAGPRLHADRHRDRRRRQRRAGGPDDHRRPEADRHCDRCACCGDRCPRRDAGFTLAERHADPERHGRANIQPDRPQFDRQPHRAAALSRPAADRRADAAPGGQLPRDPGHDPDLPIPALSARRGRRDDGRL